MTRKHSTDIAVGKTKKIVMGNRVMKNGAKRFGKYIGAGLLAASLLAGCANKGVPEEELVSTDAFEGKYLVTADYVKEHAGDENVLLVDCRGADKAGKTSALPKGRARRIRGNQPLIFSV